MYGILQTTSFRLHLLVPVNCNAVTVFSGQYYETIVRYEKFFILETQYIPGVLVSHAVGFRGTDTTEPDVLLLSRK